MSKIYISNAFSLQMTGDLFAETRKVSVEEVREKCVVWNANKAEGDDEGEHTGGSDSWLSPEVVSIVGHSDIASILRQKLHINRGTIPVNRVSVQLEDGDVLYVGQYVGPRLPEGAKELPEGAKIEWYRVNVQKDDPEVVKAREREQNLKYQKEVKEAKLKAWGLDPIEVGTFLEVEDVQYEGWGDNEGREKMAKAIGVTRQQLDILLQ